MDAPATPFLSTVLLAGAAGAMGWGIRGQYGHETGAMIAGLLTSLVLVLRFQPGISAVAAARAAGFCAAAVGFGGAMTYGQTIGLTQNEALVGHGRALAWGMLGLGLKGAIWIGFAGAFLGMAMGSGRYSPREIARLLGGLLLLTLLGIACLNLPYDPPNRVLPRIYFSADWSWYPAAGPELKPRREIWGGLLFALVGLIVYLGWIRRDLLARNLALWGCLGGLGFPIGQSLQAWHAWNADLFRGNGWLAQVGPLMSWWNWMEALFGFVWAATLAAGLWCNRERLLHFRPPDEASIRPSVEFGLLGVHLALLGLWEFAEVEVLDSVGNLGIPLSILPLIGMAGGRFWPFLMCLPVVAFPILGKTAAALGWFAPGHEEFGCWFVALPLVALLAAAIYFGRTQPPRPTPVPGPGALPFLRPTLIGLTWLYFGLNFLMFQCPWPWESWTVRTPNALVFLTCALALTWATLRQRPVDPASPSRVP